MFWVHVIFWRMSSKRSLLFYNFDIPDLLYLSSNQCLRWKKRRFPFLKLIFKLPVIILTAPFEWWKKGHKLGKIIMPVYVGGWCVFRCESLILLYLEKARWKQGQNTAKATQKWWEVWPKLRPWSITIYQNSKSKSSSIRYLPNNWH